MLHELTVNRLLKNLDSFSLLLITALFLLSSLIPTSNMSLYLIVGLIETFALLYIPGSFFLRLFHDNFETFAERFGFSLIFGFSVQIINVLVLYILPFTLFGGLRNNLYLLTLLSLVFFMFLKVRFRIRGHGKQRQFKIPQAINLRLLSLFIISLGIRLFYQSLNSNYITPDGALYCDSARFLTEKGMFSSNVISLLSDNVAFPRIYARGFIPHQFTVFALSIFFVLGGVSYTSAKMMTVFSGALLIFPVYAITKDFFGQRCGWVAAALTSFHSLLVIFSSILFGTEMIGVLFTMTALYFFILSIKHADKKLLCILSGFFWALSRFSWGINGDVFLMAVPFLVILSVIKTEAWKLKAKTVFAIFLLPFLAELVFFVHGNIELWFLFIGVNFLFLIIVARKTSKPYLKNLCIFLLVVLSIAQVQQVRRYFFPEIYQYFAKPSAEVSIPFRPSGSIPAQVEKFWNATNNSVTPVLLWLGGISLLILSRFRKHLILLVYPLIYSALFILFSSVISEPRIFVYLVPFFVMLSSSTIDVLLSASKQTTESTRISVNLSILKARLRINVKKTSSLVVVLLLIIVPVSYPFLFNEYAKGLQYMQNIDPVKEHLMEPAINWIVENTKPSDVLLSPIPSSYAWFTNRKFVGARYLDPQGLSNVLSEYGVDYIVFDKASYRFWQKLRPLWSHDVTNALGIVPVFRLNASKVSDEIFIVNATQIDFNLTTRLIADCDSLRDFESVGELGLDFSTFKTGNASIIGPAPFRNGKYNLEIDLHASINLSHVFSIKFWLKVTLNPDTNKTLQLVDSLGNWELHSFDYTKPGEWELIEIFLHAPDERSVGKLDTRQMRWFNFRFIDESREFTVWIDEISVVQVAS